MGINDLTLSPALVAALYPETLIVSKELSGDLKITQTGLTPDPGKTIYPFLGQNQQALFCFLVSYPDNEFIPEPQLAFIQKILTACKYSLDDIAIINTGRKQVEINKLVKQFDPRIIFLWGTGLDVTGIDQELPDMTITTWQNISIVPVEKTGMMLNENPEGIALKRDLWICLKKLFKL
jgi:hypothetical protein